MENAMSNSAVIGYRNHEHAPILYHYMHWKVDEIGTLIVRALEHSRPRWNDDGYATRMAISVNIPEQERMSQTGHGLYINNFPMIDEYAVPTITWQTRRIYFHNYSPETNYEPRELINIWSFEEYINHIKILNSH
jgi:hypothetical protein